MLGKLFGVRATILPQVNLEEFALERRRRGLELDALAVAQLREPRAPRAERAHRRNQLVLPAFVELGDLALDGIQHALERARLLL